MLELDATQTLALAGLSLFVGHALCRRIPVLAHYNIPAPVVGGLLLALASLFAHGMDVTLFSLDTSLQTPLMVAFFTAIGTHASLSLLRVSGRQVMIFLALAGAFTVIQNLTGIAIASLFGLSPLFGVLAGSTTMAGGPATGLAFAPLFQEAGVAGAQSVAITAAMAGIICGGLLGGPVATLLMRRHGLHAPGGDGSGATGAPASAPSHDTAVGAASAQMREAHALRSVVWILLAMWLGAWISKGFGAIGLTLPAYVGAMLVGALMRNVDDRTGWLKLSAPTIEVIGNVCLAMFLALALMNLKLWELAGLALPLLAILVAQALLVTLFAAGLVYRVMGRDYDAAVMGGGFVGFMLGTTANAMAVMQTLVQRYGMAPRAFLVAPLVGAFFIDFANALVITGFLNFWKP
ncbi:sodium/glutamate symporter [Marilutibacter maris]|uniref:Sodium/glutamate symporter n=1 Tax=Marilutibacter maris TaxID=1605891 RepID=A0A2U9T6H3_9GAMM|nr:sodium/glutamate symporter [Lysobacter maris]AWV08143.1 sodium: glutamate symporter [Lysobacter maris]